MDPRDTIPFPTSLNVGRSTVPTHHVYNFPVAFFYCLHMPRTVKLKHLYHELYSILANSCFRYNRGKAYSPRTCVSYNHCVPLRCMSAITDEEKKLSQRPAAEQEQRRRRFSLPHPRTTEKGVSDA